MSGSIFQLAKRDAKHIVTKGGFEVNLILRTPAQDLSIEITGFATKHWNSFDSDGTPINAKNVHVCVSESDLVSKGFPVRNSKGEVSMLKCKISFSDSSGVEKNYVVRETMPDETLGLIVLILGDFTV